MLMTPSVPCNESAPISSLRNARYMSPNWHACHSEVGTPLQAVSGTRFSSPYPNMNQSPADDCAHDTDVENTPLISPPSPSRPYFQPPLSAETSSLYPPPTPTLLPNQNLHHNQRRRDVFPFSVNASPRDHSDLSTNHGLPRSSHLESFQLSSSFPQNVSINASSTGLRTSYPVFHTTSALAAHHGIPQSLPPVPRTTRFATNTPSVSHSQPAPPSDSASDFDFTTLCSNYLTMLSQKPEDTQAVAAVDPMAASHDVSDDTVKALMEVIQASPEFRMVNDFSEYLTSPLDDSPLEDFLTTPALGSADSADDFFTSPAIYDADNFNDFGGAPLFPDLGFPGPAFDPIKTPTPAPSARLPFDVDGMFTMPSPTTPSLDPTSLHPSPRLDSVGPPGSRVRKNAPTGTRKNITPESLVSLDAPIQSRKYVIPSATSRKEVPAAWINKKKRSRSSAFGEEDDQLAEDGISLNPSDVDAIEAKRRQNTLAARRSRKRKLEYQRELETGLDREREEKEMWKAKALMFQALLVSHGHEVPSLDA